MPKSIQQQQGSMLIIALFIIVVISLLAVTLSRVFSSTADSVANEVYSAKAYDAAESGMDYGIYQVLRNNQVCTDFPGTTVISNMAHLRFDISDEVGFGNCRVEITCQRIPITPTAGTTISQFYLISKGTCEGGKIVTQHTVEAEVKL